MSFKKILLAVTCLMAVQLAQAGDDQRAPKDQYTLNIHLALAAFGANYEEVVRLLDQGADPNCTGLWVNPLRDAAGAYKGSHRKPEYRHEDYEKCIEALVKAGGSIQTLKNVAEKETVVHYGYLSYSVKEKHPALISLIERMEKIVSAEKDEKKDDK